MDHQGRRADFDFTAEQGEIGPLACADTSSHGRPLPARSGPSLKPDETSRAAWLSFNLSRQICLINLYEQGMLPIQIELAELSQSLRSRRFKH